MSPTRRNHHADDTSAQRSTITARGIHRLTAEHRHELDATKSRRAGIVLTTFENQSADAATLKPRRHKHRPDPRRLGLRIEKTCVLAARSAPGVQTRALAPSAASDDLSIAFDDEIRAIVDEVA